MSDELIKLMSQFALLGVAAYVLYRAFCSGGASPDRSGNSQQHRMNCKRWKQKHAPYNPDVVVACSDGTGYTRNYAL